MKRAAAVQFAYPYSVAPDGDGNWLVSFADVPEALTDGTTEVEAHANAADALIAALGGYPRVKRRVPRPSPAHGRPTVVVPLLQAAKLALHDAMLEQGVGNSALARRLGVQEGEVRRMLDLDHQTKIGSIEKALAALGRRVVAEVQLAA